MSVQPASDLAVDLLAAISSQAGPPPSGGSGAAPAPAAPAAAAAPAARPWLPVYDEFDIVNVVDNPAGVDSAGRIAETHEGMFLVGARVTVCCLPTGRPCAACRPAALSGQAHEWLPGARALRPCPCQLSLRPHHSYVPFCVPLRWCSPTGAGTTSWDCSPAWEMCACVCACAARNKK